MPQVGSDFAARLRGAITSNQQAVKERERAVEDQTNAQQELSSITVDEALIANSDEIQELFARTGAYAKDQRDIPRIQAEGDEYSADLSHLAVRLGLPDSAEVEARRLADTVYVSIRSLISEGKKLSTKLDGCKEKIETETGTLANLQEQRTERETVADPRPLREKVAALGPIVRKLDKRAELDRIFKAESRSIGGAAVRLFPPVGDLGALAKASLPSGETIGRFRMELDGIDRDIQRTTEQATEIANIISGIEKKLRDFTSQGSVPSFEAIAAERMERDHAWMSLRNSMLATTPVLVGAPLTDAILTFERHNSEADRLADSAVANASQIASYTVEVSRLKEERSKEKSTQERQISLAGKHAAAVETWKSAWTPTGVDPLTPAEMAGWLSQVHSLLERLDKNNALIGEFESIDKAVLAITPSLKALADEVGVPLIEGLDANHLVQQIQDRLKSIERIWDDSRKLETNISNSQTRIDKLHAEEAEARRQLEHWTTRWGAALPAVGLPAVATIEEAEVTLSAWQNVPDALRERDNRLRRVAGMERDSRDFEARTKVVVEIGAPDLASLPAEVAVKRINERLSESTNAKARQEQAAKRLEKSSQTWEAADALLEESKAELALLLTSISPESDPLDLLQRLARRDEVNKSLLDHRNQLISQGEGFTEEKIRAELAGFDVDQAAATLQQLSTADARLESEAREVFANQKVATNKRTQLEKGVGAEIANQQKKNSEAELVAAAHEWLILKFGALLIGHAIEQSRASHHNPLVKRAGDLFSTITGGAFVGIGQDFGEGDIPCLVGRRSSDEMVTVPGLSEGTRDQLFLALRLAYLESFAKTMEPIPFIGDDLFTSFDEDRTANGLSALAAIGDQIQPILFTHHRHVVEIARAKLGEAADVIEMRQ